MVVVARIARLLIAAAAALAAPALAHAQERTLDLHDARDLRRSLRRRPGAAVAQSPAVDGYVVGMDAEVVDAAGRVQGRDKVMLHHIVFAKVGVPDYTCGGSARALLRRGRGAARALAPARLRLREQGDRPLGAALHADEPQAAAPERVHPLHGALRHRRDADAGEAGLARRPQLHGRHRPGLRRSRRRQALLHLHEDGRLHDARERPARLGRRPPPRRRRPARARATRPAGTVPFAVAPDLGRPEAEAAPARARPDEDVVVPLDRGDPGREGPEAAARRGLRQPGAAHARDGDHAPLPRARGREGCGATPALEIDLGNPSAPPPFSMPLPRTPNGTGVDGEVDLRRRLPLREPSASR